MLKELYKDYDLDNLLDEYPETRVRFFMMTCFKGENTQLNEEFQLVIKNLRKQKLNPWDIQKRITKIQDKDIPRKDEKFFFSKNVISSH